MSLCAKSATCKSQPTPIPQIMPIRCLVLFLLLAANLAVGGERVVAEFDAKSRSIGELISAIETEVKQGATVVRFPGGRWKWHDLTKLKLKPVEDDNLVKIQIKLAEVKLRSAVEDWISENKVAAVQIGLHKDLPAETFFNLELILTQLKVPYSLFSGGEFGEGELLLIKSDGRLRILVPKNLPDVESGPSENSSSPCRSCSLDQFLSYNPSMDR